MAQISNVLPSRCCCCSLRAGSIVVATFAMLVSMTFVGLNVAGSKSLASLNCRVVYDEDTWKTICDSPNELYYMLGNLLAILAVLSAVEVITSVGLIWGASKRRVQWVTAWLIVTACWILLHGTIAVSYLFAISGAALVSAISVVVIFLLAMSLLSMLTVYSFWKELISMQLLPTQEVFASSSIPTNTAGWHPQPQPSNDIKHFQDA